VARILQLHRPPSKQEREREAARHIVARQREYAFLKMGIQLASAIDRFLAHRRRGAD
jgi:hypothetical protein